MGSVAQAVLEFDEAVQVPWRPPLAARPALRVVPGGALPGGVVPGGAVPGDRGRVHAARAGRQAPRTAATPRATPPSPDRRLPAAGAGCARCGSRGACGPRSLRLTRRAHRLVAALLAAGAVGAAAWLGALGADDDGLRLAGGSSTVVQSGDTLWSIARSVSGEADVRGVVDEIQRLNDLEGTALVPGQVLELP